MIPSEVLMMFIVQCRFGSILYLLSISVLTLAFSFGFQVLNRRHAWEMGVAPLDHLAHHIYHIIPSGHLYFCISFDRPLYLRV